MCSWSRNFKKDYIFPKEVSKEVKFLRRKRALRHREITPVNWERQVRHKCDCKYEVMRWLLLSHTWAISFLSRHTLSRNMRGRDWGCKSMKYCPTFDLLTYEGAVCKYKGRHLIHPNLRFRFSSSTLNQFFSFSWISFCK